MPDRYIIATDRAHLRIYRYSQEPGQFTPSLQPVDSFDFTKDRDRPSFMAEEPLLKENYTEGVNFDAAIGLGEDMPFSYGRAQNPALHLAERITAFMQSNPNSTWDLAADSSLRNELIDQLPDGVRRRLNQIVSKDLVNAPPAALREHFALR